MVRERPEAVPPPRAASGPSDPSGPSGPTAAPAAGTDGSPPRCSGSRRTCLPEGTSLCLCTSPAGEM